MTLIKSSSPSKPKLGKHAGIPFFELDGVKLYLKPDCRPYYRYDYISLLAEAKGQDAVNETIASLIVNDLFFVVYFVLKNPLVNHSWMIQRCYEVQNGPDDKTLDLWARGHLKSTIITQSESIQQRLKFASLPERKDITTAIFSHNRAIAKAFLRVIKFVFEESNLLKICFPHICYQDPVKEAPKWSEDDGLILKRDNFKKEPCFSAWGLLDGMPTSKHFDRRIYDDIVTDDLVQTPEMIDKVKRRYDMSRNLKSFSGTERIIGTFYDHDDALVYIMNKRKAGGENMYHTRIYPCTEDGSWNGKSVFFEEKTLDELRVDPKTFSTQMLLDPNPITTRTFHPDWLYDIHVRDIPKRIYKFILVDEAGDQATNSSGRDSWGIMCIGVEPYKDTDLGLSNIYILDAIIKPMPHTEAITAIVDMYIRNQRITAVGVEKVGLSSSYIHVQNALRTKRKSISIESDTLRLLKPGGTKKAQRIARKLEYPMSQGKWHISSAISYEYKERLRQELEKFPTWKDDGLDTCSYIYDMIENRRFPTLPQDPSERDRWEELYLKNKNSRRRADSYYYV